MIKLDNPAYTPKKSEASELLALFLSSDHKTSLKIIKALLRLPHDFLFSKILEYVDSEKCSPSVKAYLCMLVGRMQEKLDTAEKITQDYVIFLTSQLESSHIKIKRYAVNALSKFGYSSDIEDILIKLYRSEKDISVKKVIIETLGKMGQEKSCLFLKTISNDKSIDLPVKSDFKKSVSKSLLISKRNLTRASSSSAILDDKAPSKPTFINVYCRSGLEELCKDELNHLGSTDIVYTGTLKHQLKVSFEKLFSSRIMDYFSFPLGIFSGAIDEIIVKAVTSKLSQDILKNWSLGPIRFRIRWSDGSHKRSLIWNIAEQISEKSPDLINDSREPLWEFVAYQRKGSSFSIDLVPKKLTDPRFLYRVKDVPAASNPNLAAALAKLADAHDNDFVWDPFCGSGTELIERAIIGPYKAMLGTDNDKKAIIAAKENVALSGMKHIEIEHCDAFTVKHISPSLIITNPPLGRRLPKDDIDEFFVKFISLSNSLLSHEGRLIFVSPHPSFTRDKSLELGLKLIFEQKVDMGGFSGTIQKFLRI